MHHELITILAIGITMAVVQTAAIGIAVSRFRAWTGESNLSFEARNRQAEKRACKMDAGLGRAISETNHTLEEMRRTRYAIEALIVSDSERVRSLMRS